MTRDAIGRRLLPALLCSLCLICAILIKPVQDWINAHAKSDTDPDLLYFSAPSAVKKMALGYDGLMADIYWMRAIQYYGQREQADKRVVRYKNLSKLLEITTTLDPYLLDAYRMGAIFLAEADPVGAGQPRESLKLLDKGIAFLPDEWRLWNDKGFVYYWYLQDYKSAGQIWHEASKIKGAPDWMAPLAAMSLSKGGAVDVAIALWQSQYRDSTRKDVRENARNHLISIEIARDLHHLGNLIEEYKGITGAFPRTLAEATRGRSVRIVDPSGVPYGYDPNAGTVFLNPESKIVYLPVPEALISTEQK